MYIDFKHSMATYNKQLKVTHLDNYLGQIGNGMNPYTIVKFKCRAANCYMKSGSKKNLRKAIDLYNDAYNILSEHRGAHDARTLDVALSIVKCEKKLEKVLANSVVSTNKKG